MKTIKNDIKENQLLRFSKELLTILLKDMTTKKNIIWATDMYKSRGAMYQPDSYITIEAITGYHGGIIKPRVDKSMGEQKLRSKKKAEVFTPSWVCNAQNNLVDYAWFGRGECFNLEIFNGWIRNPIKIPFKKNSDKTWQEYVKTLRLEITCGEAPYLTSRYDTVNGEYIQVPNRIGLLDRKLRVISENIAEEVEWINWAKTALKSVYGYDWQGDNVLIARENLLYSTLEHFEYQFKKELDLDTVLEFAKIIVWNVWQMDGIKLVVPDSCHKSPDNQISFFEDKKESLCVGCSKNSVREHNGIYCKIKDWEKDKTIKFLDLMRG